MTPKKWQDIGFVVGCMAGLAGIMLVLWFLLTVISVQIDIADRCRAAGGEMLRGMQCVEVIKDY